jgi:hypothetical protein
MIGEDGVIKITIERTHIRGVRGQHFRVYADGAVLVEDTWNPEHDACRALVARGITGRFETWWRDSQHGSMRGDIETCAKQTIEESAKVGLKLRDWHTWDEEDLGDAVSRGDVKPGRASKPEPVGEPALAQKAANDATFPPESDAA